MRWHETSELIGRITVLTVDPTIGDLTDVDRLFARLGEAPRFIRRRACALNRTSLAGKKQLLALGFAQSGAPWIGVALGTNGAGLAGPPGDLALYAEKIRVPLASVTQTDDGVNAKLVVRAVLGQTQGNGETYQEAAIVNSLLAGQGVLYNRVIFTPVGKTDQFYLFAQFDLTQK